MSNNPSISFSNPQSCKSKFSDMILPVGKTFLMSFMKNCHASFLSGLASYFLITIIVFVCNDK